MEWVEFSARLAVMDIMNVYACYGLAEPFKAITGESLHDVIFLYEEVCNLVCTALH